MKQPDINPTAFEKCTVLCVNAASQVVISETETRKILHQQEIHQSMLQRLIISWSKLMKMTAITKSVESEVTLEGARVDGAAEKWRSGKGLMYRICMSQLLLLCILPQNNQKIKTSQ